MSKQSTKHIINWEELSFPLTHCLFQLKRSHTLVFWQVIIKVASCHVSEFNIPNVWQITMNMVGLILVCVFHSLEGKKKPLDTLTPTRTERHLPLLALAAIPIPLPTKERETCSPWGSTNRLQLLNSLPQHSQALRWQLTIYKHRPVVHLIWDTQGHPRFQDNAAEHANKSTSYMHVIGLPNAAKLSAGQW